MASPIRLDAGRSVVAWCVECPSWRRMAHDKPEALRLSAEHMALVHADDDGSAAGRDLRQRAKRVERRAEG